MSRPLLYSPTGDVVASVDTLDPEAKALLVDCFGAVLGRLPVGFPGGVDEFVTWITNRIFAMVGQQPIEARFGVKITAKAEGQPS